jgi:coenzyme F420 hydrogenase subunit beta
MNVTHDLSGVLASDLCIGCGACVFADPSLELQLDPVKLIYEPSHAGNATAASVCPAVQVDYRGLQDRLFPGAEQTPYGVVHSVVLAQSTDEDRNLRASSGGLIKELLIALLERDDVDGVIALGHVEGLAFEPRLLTAVDEVDRLPGSIYHNLPKHRVLELLREHDGRFVLVGIPCELEGIFQYVHTLEPRLAERIATTVGLLCGWQYSHHALKAICEFKGIEFDAITDVSYRGGGPVGKLRIRTADGRTTSASRRVDFGYQVAFDRTFNTPRCHLCVNHSNFLADIVVGDAWLPSTVATRTGISLVINRTAAADGLLRELETAGRVVCNDVTVEEIKESQKRRVAFGDFAYAYADYLDEVGVHRPILDGPNRAVAELVDRDEVAFFHRELTTKLALQRQGRYRYLYWRKATKELPRFLTRYWEWFTVRILRIKSLTGERQEIPREELSRFR